MDVGGPPAVDGIDDCGTLPPFSDRLPFFLTCLGQITGLVFRSNCVATASDCRRPAERWPRRSRRGRSCGRSEVAAEAVWDGRNRRAPSLRRSPAPCRSVPESGGSAAGRLLCGRRSPTKGSSSETGNCRSSASCSMNSLERFRSSNMYTWPTSSSLSRGSSGATAKVRRISSDTATGVQLASASSSISRTVRLKTTWPCENSDMSASQSITVSSRALRVGLSGESREQ